MSNQVFIIAEAGVNHNGSLSMALELIDVAVEAGADAVKFQTFQADQEISVYAPKAEYQRKTTAIQESQLEMVKRLELGLQQHRELFDYCQLKGIEFLSTPFDMGSLALLINELKLKRIKISSGDITTAPLMLNTARTGREIILSTGMSTLGEVEEALGVLAFGYLNQEGKPSFKRFKEAYNLPEAYSVLREKVSLLHCTTEYPAPSGEVNLKAIDTLKSAFNLRVGYSDHTEGITIPIAAVARGAEIIEKHFTLSKSLPGPDHKASLEPGELKDMIKAIRQVEKALGSGKKVPAQSEMKNIVVARKGLVARVSIKKGDILSEENVTYKRPANGLSPMIYWDVLGAQAIMDFEEDMEIAPNGIVFK
ncbi:MAG: N-acetylneuraminate synthase [Ignavibacteriales bacterium]